MRLFFCHLSHTHDIIENGHLGLLDDISISPPSQGDSAAGRPQLAQYAVPRGLYFLDDDTLAITFFGNGPLGYLFNPSLALITLKSLPPQPFVHPNSLGYLRSITSTFSVSAF